MPRIQFPNVPSVPGVPDLIRKSGDLAPVVRGALGIIQGSFWNALKGTQLWGIYEAGSTEAMFGNPSGKTPKQLYFSFLTKQDFQVSVLSIDLGADSMVSDFPVERGSFANYNKVLRPKMIRVSYAVNGSNTEKADFLNALEDARDNTTLFDVLTPEKHYHDYTISSFNYSRSADSGSNLMIFDIVLNEIRQVQAAYFTNAPEVLQDTATSPVENTAPLNPEAAAKQDIGKTSPVVPKDSTFFGAIGNYLNELKDSVINGNKKYK